MSEDIALILDDKYDRHDSDDYTNDLIKVYLKEIGKFPRLSDDEQRELFIQYKKYNDMAAFDKIFKSNLRLAVFAAKKNYYRYKNLDFLDLVQEYNIILYKAIQLYDLSGSAKLSTYVLKAMDNRTQRIKVNQDSNIKNPYLNKPNYFRYKKFVHEFYNKNYRLPTKEEIMDGLQISSEIYNNIIHADNIYEQSLNQTVKNNDDSSELMDFIADETDDFLNNEKFIDEQILKKALQDRLTEKEYYIIYYRYLGLDLKTQKEIGLELKVSDRTIRKIEKSVLDKIKFSLDKLQQETVKKYSIKDLTNANLKPLSPIEISLLHYLKNKLPDINYQILYTKIVHPQNHNVKYYLNKFTYLQAEEIIDEINLTLEIEQKYFSESTMNSIFEIYVNEYTIDEIFKLDIKPELIRDYNKLADFLEQITYDDIKDYEYIKSLDLKSKKLIMRYFEKNSRKIRPKYDFERIERDINLFLIGHYKRNNPILTKEEIKRLIDVNKDRLTTNQIDIIKNIYLKSSNHNVIDKNRYYSDIILLSLKFKFYHYFDNELIVSQIKQVLSENKNLLTNEEKYYINTYMGIDTPKKSLKELAQNDNIDYELLRDKITTIKFKILKKYYDLDQGKKDISTSEFLKYLNDPRYDFSCDTRKIMIDYLQGKDYKTLSLETGFNLHQISNFITEGIRQANLYYYGIIKVFTPTNEELDMFFTKYQYSKRNIRIIKKRFLDNIIYIDIAASENLSHQMIKKITEKFYEQYLIDKIEVVPIDEYEKEVMCHESFSVLTKEERKLLSFLYGITCSYNKIGQVYKKEDIEKEFKNYQNNLKLIDKKIREKLLNLRNPEFGIIPRNDLIEILKDSNLPISEKEKEIICHLSGINGFEYLDANSLASKYNIGRKSSIKRSYQRAILSIIQYENNKKKSVISYAKDIAPIEKYFSNYDRNILKMYYEDKLTVNQISDILKISVYQTRFLITKLRINVKEILINSKTAKKFDFNIARKIINDSNFYLGRNHDLLIKIYKMAHGEDNYPKYSIREIKEILNLNATKKTLNNAIYKVMIEIEKYKLGLKKKTFVSREEIERFYIQNNDNMTLNKKKVYTKFLNKKNRFSEIDEIVPMDIIYDVMKSNNKLVFKLDCKTKEEMKRFIIINKGVLPKSTIATIKKYYDIEEREIMSGKEKLKVFKLLEPIYQKKILESKKTKIKQLH